MRCKVVDRERRKTMLRMAVDSIIVALIPQRPTTCQISLDAVAIGFDDVLTTGLCIERWQLTVPIDDLGLLTCCVHTNDRSRLRAGRLRRRFDRPFLRTPARRRDGRLGLR
jgi:hypothetical protein